MCERERERFTATTSYATAGPSPAVAFGLQGVPDERAVEFNRGDFKDLARSYARAGNALKRLNRLRAHPRDSTGCEPIPKEVGDRRVLEEAVFWVTNWTWHLTIVYGVGCGI